MSELFTISDDAVIVDRSELERFSECPRQAAFTLQSGQPLTAPLASGQAVHDCISRVIAGYLANPNFTPAELADWLREELANSRTDLQPDIVRGGSPAAWGIANLIARMHPGNVLKFDGGEGDLSGQVSRDVVLGETVYRVTTEVDLLLSTESPEVIREIDWKSGWTPWDEAAVRDSFQFQLHAWILLGEVYPDCGALDVQIGETRRNSFTRRVRLERRDLDVISPRIMQALAAYDAWREKCPQEAPAHPLDTRCSRCAHAIDCLDASPAHPSGVSHEAMVDWLTVHAAAAALATKQLWKERDRRGADIVSPHGNAFGWDKPKRASKPVNPVYSTATKGGDDAE